MKHLYGQIIFVLVFLSLSSLTYAQQYYVIVGAFSQENHAQKFTGYVRSHEYNGNYELHKENSIYYVYVLKTNIHDEAISLVKHLQAGSEFKDAWVYTGALGNQDEMNQLLSQLNKHVTKVNDTLTQQTAKPDSIVLNTAPGASQTTPDTAQIKPVIAITEIPETGAVTKDSAVVSNVVPEHVRGKLFRFAIQTPDGKPLRGEVHQVDFNLGHEIATFKGNQYIDMMNPMKNNPMTIVCGIFGYKEVIDVIDYRDPSATEGVTKDQHNAWIIPFKLERMKKGDISVMYHVSFYKDAVVMLPQSKTELNELVNMMSDNPEYKIKIHGHCNGNNARKIIALGESKNYFNVKGSAETTGSAKELSKLRAEAIQTYLADHGIDKSRSQIYAWGGLNMLVDEHSNSAKLNDRIEIEITAD
jgi:outer membrane protein OmpA-like peptidoglycan-associated protein